MEYIKPIITEYDGFGEYEGRRSVVLRNGDGYEVLLYDYDTPLHQIDLSDKSLQYAEDTAENWVLGVGEFE